MILVLVLPEILGKTIVKSTLNPRNQRYYSYLYSDLLQTIHCHTFSVVNLFPDILHVAVHCRRELYNIFAFLPYHAYNISAVSPLYLAYVVWTPTRVFSSLLWPQNVSLRSSIVQCYTSCANALCQPWPCCIISTKQSPGPYPFRFALPTAARLARCGYMYFVKQDKKKTAKAITTRDVGVGVGWGHYVMLSRREPLLSSTLNPLCNPH